MAFTTAKMGLKIWNLLTDLYDHAQLADNWAKVDYHDHSPGKGVQIPTEGLADNAVTAAKLGGNVDPSGAYTSLKPIIHMANSFGGGAGAGTYPLHKNFSAAATTPWGAIIAPLYLDPTDWTASGRTVNYVIRGNMITNAVAPGAGVSYNFGLYPITAWGGASGAAPTVTALGSVVTDSTTPTISNPAAGGPTAQVIIEFAAPVAGWYALCVVQTGSAAANAHTVSHATLYAKQV